MGGWVVATNFSVCSWQRDIYIVLSITFKISLCLSFTIKLYVFCLLLKTSTSNLFLCAADFYTDT